jgi:hypothetical protein
LSDQEQDILLQHVERLERHVMKDFFPIPSAIDASSLHRFVSLSVSMQYGVDGEVDAVIFLGWNRVHL